MGANEVIKEDDKITLAAYARERGLLDEPGWKWARRITKNPKKFIRMARIFASQTQNLGQSTSMAYVSPRATKRLLRLTRPMETHSGKTRSTKS